jgi:HEAT repeat protein
VQFPDPGTDPTSACLVKCGKAAVPLLLSRLRDPKVTNERLTELVNCLGRLGPTAREALPLLASNEMLGRVDDATKLVTAINSIGATAECLPFLIEAVSNGQFAGNELNTAILSLGERARSAIVGLLESDRLDARLAGRTMILQLGKKAETDIPAITGILARGAGDEGALMQILATFGPPARLAVPAVARRLNSPYVRIRSTACITLGRIASGSPEARAAVTRLLVAATKDDFAEVRAAAADALGLLGTPTRPYRKRSSPCDTTHSPRSAMPPSGRSKRTKVATDRRPKRGRFISIPAARPPDPCSPRTSDNVLGSSMTSESFSQSNG